MSTPTLAWSCCSRRCHLLVLAFFFDEALIACQAMCPALDKTEGPFAHWIFGLAYAISLSLNSSSNEFSVALSCFVTCSLLLAFGYFLVVRVLVFRRLSRSRVKAIVRLLVAIGVFGSFLMSHIVYMAVQ